MQSTPDNERDSRRRGGEKEREDVKLCTHSCAPATGVPSVTGGGTKPSVRAEECYQS